MKSPLAAAVLLALLAAPAPAQDGPGARARALQKRVTALRGLEFKSDVETAVHSRAELRAFLEKELDEDLPAATARLKGRIAVHFGLLPEGADLRKLTTELHAGAVAGYYHPKTKRLRLVRDPAPPDGEAELLRQLKELGVKLDSLEEITLVHELVHAAQDQNHDLSTLPLEVEGRDDLALAVRALVEGDATIAGLQHGFQEVFDNFAPAFLDGYKQASLPGASGALPAALRKPATFPYGYGAEFVLAILAKSGGSWKAVSAAFDDLPASTEQILHPEKYLDARDRPQELSIGDAASFAPGWTLRSTNGFGEFGIRVLLDETKRGTARTRAAAAAGWDGDRYWIYEDARGGLASLWASTWDTEEDAAEFAAALAESLDLRLEGAARVNAGAKSTWSRADGRVAVAERRGTDVVVLDGADAALAGRINAAWTALKKTETGKVGRVPAK